MTDTERIQILKDELITAKEENLNLINTVEKLNLRIKTSSENYIKLQDKLAAIKQCTCPIKNNY